MSSAVWSFVAGVSVGLIVGVAFSFWLHRPKTFSGVAGDERGSFRRIFGPHL